MIKRSTKVAVYWAPHNENWRNQSNMKIFRSLKTRRELIAAEADEFMEAYGNSAYWKARESQREARKSKDYIREKFLGKVCLEIAKRTDFEIGLDTATRYLEDKQEPYNHGPPLLLTNPNKYTLH